MTDFDIMLDFFSPETDYVDTYCSVCGAPLSVRKRGTKRPLCEDCKRAIQRERDHEKYLAKSKLYYRFGDPIVDLVGAIIRQAENDAAWQRRFRSDGQELDLEECDAKDFILDGGVELWLRAIGLGVQPSLLKKLNTLEEK
jgi:transposase-like protein